MSNVVISGSSRLGDRVAYWKSHFESLGHTVIATPELWDDTQDFATQLTDKYVNFYDALDRCDIFFLMNEDRNDLKGYVGANATAELVYMVTQKLRGKSQSKIYLYQLPEENILAYDEITSYVRVGWAEVYAPPAIGDIANKQ